MPGQLQMGQNGRVTVFLENRGSEPVQTVAVRFRGSFFDHVVLRDSSATPLENEPANGNGRVFQYGPLGAREERPLTFDVTASEAGDFDLTLTIFVNRLDTESISYAGKGAVLP
jgi:hypothetical protein